MYNPDVDDSEPLNPVEDGSGYYNKLADSPEFNRYNVGMTASNKGFSDEADKRAALLTKTPTKQSMEDEQHSKKGTPKRRTQKTPAKLRFNVTETQPSPVAKKSNTTKHTRSASTGQQYMQPSPPPSPKFRHPYQQLKGSDTADHNDVADKSTGYANISVDGSPRLSSDSPVHVDMNSPVTSFFREALQSTPLTKQSSNLAEINSLFTVTTGNSSVVSEAPVSMATVHGMSNVWGASPHKPVQHDNGNMAPASEWIVSPELREKFAAQFRDLKPENGLLYGDKARVFFLKSKLQSKDLSMIWKLADVDKDGRLSEEEFCIAMKMVLVRRKGYSIPSTIPEPLLPSKPSVISSIPPLLSHASFHTVPNARDDASTHLPALTQHHQLKSQTLPIGIKPAAPSNYPAQLPLLPPPSRKQFTRTNTGGSIDIPVTSRFNGNDEQGNSPTDHHAPSKTTGLSHSNWPSTLTSDSGKPLKFNSNMEPTAPLPPTLNDAPQSPLDNSNMEKSHLVTSSNKHKTSGPAVVDLGPKPEMVQSPTKELPSVKHVAEVPAKAKSKKPVVPVSKDDSGDEQTFDSDEDDETSALYAVVKPRGAKGKSSESKTHKHSTLRTSNSFKKHKPKPPPKPEPYSIAKYKKKSTSPSPVSPPVDTAAATDSGPGSMDVQEQVNTTTNVSTTTGTTSDTTSDRAKVEESSVTVDDPSALYAKVMKKKTSMDLMEPIPLDQDFTPLQKVTENNVIPSVDKDDDDTKTITTATTATATSSNSTIVTGASTDITSSDTSDVTDGLFSHNPVQLVSMTRVKSDSKANNDTVTTVTTATTTTTATTATTTVTVTAAAAGDDKPVPLPRKKHHRSSSLDLNKMFQKRKSAEQLVVSPDSLTKDLPSAVPPKPPPKPRKPKPVTNVENELTPQFSRSASLDSINSAAGNMGNIVNAQRDLFEKSLPVPLTPPVLERFGPHHESQHKKKKPLLPPHLRSHQPDAQVTSSGSSNDLITSSSSQEHSEKRDKTEIQKNIRSLKEETKALKQLNQNLQQMLMRLTEERILLSSKLESSTKHHSSS